MWSTQPGYHKGKITTNNSNVFNIFIVTESPCAHINCTQGVTRLVHTTEHLYGVHTVIAHLSYKYTCGQTQTHTHTTSVQQLVRIEDVFLTTTTKHSHREAVIDCLDYIRLH